MNNTFSMYVCHLKFRARVETETYTLFSFEGRMQVKVARWENTCSDLVEFPRLLTQLQRSLKGLFHVVFLSFQNRVKTCFRTN